jgi:predicted transcriptional regulator
MSLADRNLFAYNRGMRTLHLRNVPDDVMNRLERLARAASTSVTAVAIRELDAATRRVDNAALIATLPDLNVPADAIAEHIAADRR